MLRLEGERRSHRENQNLAGYLAFVAGLVNSAGFVLLGTFTSHVTGNVGRLANDLAWGRHAAAVRAGAMLAAFFLGSFSGSLVIEATGAQRRTHVYGSLLFCEAALLAGFYLVSELSGLTSAESQDLQALALCAAMGLQNCLVTRLSGAVVRTTHLTGVVTDLGIEGARWARYTWARLWARIKGPTGHAPVSQPLTPKTVLLLVILTMFLAGSLIGALSAVYFPHGAFALPLGLLILGGALGFLGPQDVVHDTERR
jgi:uncharacterized membrane protein YoaK (UPF0700 family)